MVTRIAMPSSPVVLVLASGKGERFIASGGKGSKLQALLAGKPVLEHTLDAVRASGLPWHLESADHEGMGDCIAAAVRATHGASGRYAKNCMPRTNGAVPVHRCLSQASSSSAGAVFGGHLLDDAADVHHGALVSSGADVLHSIRGPYLEVYSAAVRPDDLGMAGDLAADWSRH